MTPAERARELLEREQTAMTRADYERLADERFGCGPDACVIRWNEREEPWVA